MSRARITDGELQAVCDRLNRQTGAPAEPYTRGADGRMHANIGNRHISHCYGGVCLHQIMSEGGGVRDVLMSGHVPRRELLSAMFAYLQGLSDGGAP